MMSVRFVLGAVAVLAVAACQPAVPEDSRFGVGFDQTFDAQRANREAALAAGNAVPAAPVVRAQPLPATVRVANAVAQPLPVAGSAADTAAQTTALLAQTSQRSDAESLAATANNSGVAPVVASPSNPPPEVVDSTTGFSRENNFDAVSGQRSIESDAARLAANRAQYQVIQPQALPKRTDTGPNIVAYALATSHPVGTKKYRRNAINAKKRYERSCGQYRYKDQAQTAFLAAGGPKRDRAGMDPDGDGYACRWDPSVFRNISGG